MKLKKGTLLFLLLTCLAYTTLAQTDYELQGSDVTINENGIITACSYDFNANKATGGTNLTIPKSVTKDSEIIIKGIGDEAFKEKSLVAVVFEEGSEVTTIGASAFQNNQITALTLPTTLTSIGADAFSGNTGLTITLPEHAKGADVTYKDSNDQEYDPNDENKNTFTNFDRSLAIEIPPSYTLQAGDVTVVDGIITECHCEKFDNNKRIIIPEKIGTETITGIKYNVFQEKNLVAVAFASDSEVTTIGNNAFRYNPIVTLTLPTTLKTIGRQAFERNVVDTGNNKITELILPASLTTIGNHAFQYNKIAKLTIPGDSQLETIGEGAFQYSNIKEKLTLPATLKTIGDYAFRYNSITELILPATLETIGLGAFLLNSITELSLPPTLTTIGGAAFQDNSLITVTFDDDPNKSQIKSIGSDAFSRNTGLTGITLPEHAGGDDVTYKDSDNQEYDPNDDNKKTFTNFERSLAAVFPAHQLTAEDVTVVDGIITKCYCTFVSNKIIIPEKIDGKPITGIADRSSSSKGVFQEKSLVAVAFAAESKITSIGSYAFFKNQIATLTLPTTVTTIGDLAFANNNITTSPFPENSQLKTIGNNAFSNNGIATLALPATVTTIETNAFINNNITELTFPENSQLTTIGKWAFQGNQIATLTLPTTVTTIGEGAFQSQKNNSLTSVAFAGDQNNKSMIRSIGIAAFKDNSTLAPITLPYNGNPNFLRYVNTQGKTYVEGATIENFTLGYNAFIPYTLTAEDIVVDSGIITGCVCNNFTSRDISIPASIITKDGNPVDIVGIRYDVFVEQQLTSVVLPEGLISIGISAFDYNSLATVIIPRSVKYIGSRAFYNNNLTAVTFAGDEANIISIGHEAFRGNTDLSINLPSHTLATDDNFSYKDSNGNEYAEKAEFKDFDRSLYVDIPYTLTANDIKVDDNGVITGCNCNNFDSRTITIPTTIEKSGSNVTITGIEKDVFQNETLATVSFAIGSQITAIGRFAFNSNSIGTLTLPTTLTTIGEYAFGGNPLESFTLPLATKEGFRTYWQDGNSKDLGTNLTILKADFAKSFKLVSIQQFTLTLTIDETGASSEVSGLNAGKNKIDKGADFELKATPASGQRFVSWTIDGKTIEYNPHTLTTIEADIGITVTFEAIPQQVTLTLAIEGEGSINPLVKPNSVDPDNEMKGMYDINTEVSLEATSNEGWRFDKWVISDEQDKTDNPTTITMATDKTATAHFVEQVTLTLTIHGVGLVEGLKAGDNPVDKGQPLTLTAKPNGGNEFVKWVDGSDISTPTYTISDDKTQDNLSIEVHFKEKDISDPVELTINIVGQGTVTPNTGINTYERGSGVDLTATPADGWRFDKWVISDEQDKTDETTTITLDADKTATAHFVQQFTLTTAVAEQQGGTIAPLIDPNGKVYDINTKVELTATPNDGWRFDRWVISDEENETDKTTTITLDKNKTATAHFVEQVTLTLIIEETEASGEVSGLSAGKNKIDKGADFKLKATPASGQKFVSWTIGVETIVTEEYTLPATDTETDISITVTFEAIQVTLTLAIEGQQGGTISATPKPSLEDNQYDIDTEVELTATPDEGWKFDKWVIGTDEITENPTTITLNQDKTATAHFVEEEEEEAITSILTEVVSATPYPNPVTSQITLKAKDGDLIQLFSQKGEQQYSTQHTGNEVHTIDVSTMPVGVYLVRITDAEGNTTTKRILKK